MKFLPHVLRSTVLCDTERCDQRIAVTHDVTEERAAAAAMALGWDVTRGAHRWHHHCPRHAGGRP